MSASAPFIVLEGLDGSGKSTIARLLADALDAVALSTPALELAAVRKTIDTTFRQAPRAAQLFYASTVAHASERARTLTAAGRVVVCDRYWLSTRVYDSLRSGAVDLTSVEVSLFPADFTVLIEVEESERRRRLNARGLSPADMDALPHGRRLMDAYRAALSSPVAGRVLVIDSTLLTPDECSRRVLQIVRAS